MAEEGECAARLNDSSSQEVMLCLSQVRNKSNRYKDNGKMRMHKEGRAVSNTVQLNVVPRL